MNRCTTPDGRLVYFQYCQWKEPKQPLFFLLITSVSPSLVISSTVITPITFSFLIFNIPCHNISKFKSMIIHFLYCIFFKLKHVCPFTESRHYTGKSRINIGEFVSVSINIISPYKHIARQVPISHYRSIQPREIGCAIRQKNWNRY